MKTFVVITGLILSSTQVLAAGDVQRGRDLHKDNCISCHANMLGGDGTGIYTRPDRKIESFEALNNQVKRCKTALGVEWPQHQIEDVIAYLNETFYKFEK